MHDTVTLSQKQLGLLSQNCFISRATVAPIKLKFKLFVVKIKFSSLT